MASNAKNVAELLNTDTTVKVADIEDGSITTAKLAADAVTAAKLADDSVVTANITDGAISLVKTSGIGGGGKNVIINSEMMIAQRGTSFASVGNVYTLDRFAFYKQNSGAAFTVTQSTVTDLPGFGHALKVDCTTADTSLAANEQGYIVTKIEGRELQRFAKGHGSDALPMTLSFYVKTNKTGVYTARIYDRDNGRNVSGSYTVANANWNRYTITFPADASGKLDNDVNSSLEFFFNLYAGADTNTGSLVTSWAASADAGSTTGQVNFADSTSNDWEITGIQLETGSSATPFEHRTRGEHLNACQRYLQDLTPTNSPYLPGSGSVPSNNNGVCVFHVALTVQMRTTPSLTATAGNYHVYNGGGQTVTSIALNGLSPVGGGINCNAPNMVAREAAGCYANGNHRTFLVAEL